MQLSKTLMAGALVAASGGAFAQLGNGTAGPINANLPAGAPLAAWDATYNVCRGPYPQCYNDWINRNAQPNRVLIFTRTAGPRHANIGPRMAAGLNPPLEAGHVAQKALIDWLAAAGIQADWTEEVTRVPGAGSPYKAVIFLNNSRDALWKHGTAIDPASAVNTTTGAYLDQGKVNLRQYIRSGGGFVAIHNAFGTEYNWPWYEGLLGNANYYDHGANQNGTINIVNSDPSTAGLPATFPFRDEWYNLVPYPTKVKFLATVDENTLATRRTTHPGHGNFHPITWCQYYDGGRAWLTTVGHDGQAFVDGSGFPGQQQFKQMLVQGIKSAMGLTPFCT